MRDSDRVLSGEDAMESTSFAQMKEVGCCLVDPLWLALMSKAEE